MIRNNIAADLSAYWLWGSKRLPRTSGGPANYKSARSTLIRITGAILAAAFVLRGDLPTATATDYALTTLHNFDVNTNGVAPNGSAPISLVADASGNLYGATGGGGAYGYGTVFKINAGTNTLTTLVTFNGVNGALPTSFTADASGNLYGTTEEGGADGNGTVFKIDAGTNHLTDLIQFNFNNGVDGGDPTSLTTDASGNLYGTASRGGADGYGTVFKIDAGTSHLTDLIQFNARNGLDGGWPTTVTADPSGNLYGSTSIGGANGYGTVFKIDAGTNHLTDVAANDASTTSLMADVRGSLYGTTSDGGANGDGTVFEIAAGSHAITTLATFNGDNGQAPYGSLISDAAGNLYGTTASGGANNQGTVFEIAAGSHALTTLVTFNGANGAEPFGGLIADAAGNIYGTTTHGGTFDNGTVFELSPASTALPVLIGTNQIASLSGGVGSVGGGDASLPNVTAPGTFSSNYETATSQASLQTALGAATTGINFGLVGQNPDGSIAAGSAVQFWDFHFSGAFSGTATVTLHYDPTLTGGVDPSHFQIWHFTDGSWMPVANEVVDPVADTITFTTDSFSPFILGVPEPRTLILAALGAFGFACARRFRRR